MRWGGREAFHERAHATVGTPPVAAREEPAMHRRLACVSALVLATLGFCGGVHLAAAQGAGAWPERAIRIVLPFPPGGPSDIAARLAADKMQPALKQPLVIENKPGAGGNVGTADVARATPDGYTWLFGPDSLVTVN